MKNGMTPEIQDRLCYYASLAPSPHNAQPWKFICEGSSILVYLDRSRLVLRELDPQSLEVHLACGAAVTNFHIGAEFEGFSARISRFPDVREPDLLARIEFEPRKRKRGGNSPSLFAAMLRRQTNRSHYFKGEIPQDLQNQIKIAVAEYGLDVHWIARPVDISSVAELAEKAGTLKFSHEGTHKELYNLMRFSSRAAARSRDGLDMGLFFINRGTLSLAKQALKWPVLKALGSLGQTRKLARQSEADPIRSSPVVGLISTPGPRSPNSFFRGGEAFEKLAILAELAGISVQPHSAPIEVSLTESNTGRPILHELKKLFALGSRSNPVILFRMGYASQKQPYPSMRRPVPTHLNVKRDSEFYSNLTSRNTPIVMLEEQEKLASARVLVAGCGSIGGATLECLSRLGVQNFVLADPGVYELNNLNRQNAFFSDVGRNKGIALKDRILAINPHAQVLVDTRGVVEENVQYLVGSCDVIIDGVDVTEDRPIHLKRLLHQEACHQRRSVILGLDLGGTQVVHIYDYRSGDLKPFRGRISADLSQKIHARTFLSRMLSPSDLPLDFLAFAQSYLLGRAGPPPQLGPTALQFGVLAAWAAYDLICGRSVREKVKINIPAKLSPQAIRLKAEVQRWSILPKLKLLSLLPETFRSQIP